jgi:hypothetical protein
VTSPALARAIELLGLTDAEMVALFHVSPAELAEWRKGDVPATHAADVAAVEDVAKRLAVWLDPAQLRHFVRQPRAELGGRPLLQALAEDGAQPVHAAVDRLLASGLLP